MTTTTSSFATTLAAEPQLDSVLWAELDGRCRMQVLLDPERIFASSSFLFDVLANYGNRADEWRVIGRDRVPGVHPG